MQVQIEFWQLLSVIGAVIAVFGAMIWAFGKVLMAQFEQRLGERFETIQTDMTKRAAEDAEVAKQLRQFERDFAKFQIDMPVLYVRREDYIRGQTVIESKLDAVYSKLELVQIQGAKRD